MGLEAFNGSRVKVAEEAARCELRFIEGGTNPWRCNGQEEFLGDLEAWHSRLLKPIFDEANAMCGPVRKSKAAPTALPRRASSG